MTKKQHDQRTKRHTDKKTKGQRTQTKKRVQYCDVRAVSHSCDVFCKILNFCQALQPTVPFTLFVTTCSRLNHTAVKGFLKRVIQFDIPAHHFIWLLWIFTSCLSRVFQVSGVLLVGLLELTRRRLWRGVSMPLVVPLCTAT